MKKFKESIGNQTRDLLACSAVPQGIALPCARFLPCGVSIKLVGRARLLSQFRTTSAVRFALSTNWPGVVILMGSGGVVFQLRSVFCSYFAEQRFIPSGEPSATGSNSGQVQLPYNWPDESLVEGEFGLNRKLLTVQKSIAIASTVGTGSLFWGTATATWHWPPTTIYKRG